MNLKSRVEKLEAITAKEEDRIIVILQRFGGDNAATNSEETASTSLALLSQNIWGDVYSENVIL